MAQVRSGGLEIAAPCRTLLLTSHLTGGYWLIGLGIDPSAPNSPAIAQFDQAIGPPLSHEQGVICWYPGVVRVAIYPALVVDVEAMQSALLRFLPLALSRFVLLWLNLRSGSP